MEFLIIALIIAKFCERGAIDITSMVTGNQPPSKTFREARGDNAGDGPLARMIKGWWADAIEDIDEARRAKRMETKEEKEAARARRAAERQRVIDEAAKPEAEEVPTEEAPKPDEFDGPLPPVTDEVIDWDKPEGSRPVDDEVIDWDKPQPATWRTDRLDGEPEVVDWDELGRRLNETPAEQTRDDILVVPALDPPVENGEPVKVLSWEKVEERLESDETPAEQTRDDIPVVPAIDPPVEENGPVGPVLELVSSGPGTDPDEWTTYEAKPQLYAVPDQESTGGTTMTQTADTSASTGAVEGGLGAHIRWTAATADYQTRAATHVETVGAQMAQGENGPERLAQIARIQELHAMLRAEYEKLNGVLCNDRDTVAQAYAATGGQAGGKDYVRAE